MIQPDSHILGLDRKREYDDVIIEIMTHSDGDVFLTDNMMEFHLRNDPSPSELDLYMELAEEAHNKFNFALIFQNFLRGTAWVCSDRLNEFGIEQSVIQNDIRDEFFHKYLYMINWLWSGIKKYGIWSPIKFIGSLITRLIMMSSKTHTRTE